MVDLDTKREEEYVDNPPPTTAFCAVLASIFVISVALIIVFWALIH